ncbi:alpha/beta hydrolase [Nodosilinea sp. PGN35]|uniref:alpha/beta hydrolase n=1 Tax=Nodosilinea sp. PGN35 TaxID=3020489 RepID=UPI0023B337FC|nr:alpha/beta hydrolase [Nodosilinea sp. TSF1-S3]MDF0369772.1 alpha/beta hydrolase [Nodosilinea sp. TSF1-S3]
MSQPTRCRRFLPASLATATLAIGSVLFDASLPRPGYSAEEIRINTTGPLVLTVSVDALETFAATGEITPELKLYARFLSAPLLAQLRTGLNFKLPLDVVMVDNVAYSPLGRDVLFNLGKVVRTTSGDNGQIALRAAVINAAANAGPEGWTLIDALRAFPTQSIDIDLMDLLALRRELSLYFSYNRAANGAIQAQAAAEALTEADLDVARLPDLSQPGPYSFQKATITVTNPATRQTAAGLTVNYDFDSDIYIPNGLSGPAPIVIISHGFGDVKESFTFLAEHLASYGFVAIIPDHVGSDLAYRQTYLQGRLNTLLSPMEFVNRPQEISYLIDRLEELTAESGEWAAIADPTRIGVVGDSLGGSTALALGGAEINYARLVENCDQESVILNFSLYLECRARFLPPQNYALKDPRIKAVVAAHPLGGGLYGPEGFGQIDVPLLMVSGGNDIVSTVVTEQIHPFVWLQSEPKYLALFEGGTHFTSKPGRDGAGGIFKLLAGEHRDVGSRYYKILSVAFWNAYLRDQKEFLPYLTARYGEFISEGQPMAVDIISELSASQLEAAYGGTPPIPVMPTAIASLPAPREETILAEIARTGTLKVGLRKDAAPFGFINRDNAWDGYCGDMALSLGRYLTDHLTLASPIQVVELTSTLDNRYSLVQDGTVHLECGPNTIRSDVAGITFSNPIFVGSAQFLTLAGQAKPINPNLPLEGVRLGILSNTTTEQFVQSTYPRADRVTFSGPEGRRRAIQAVQQGSIDAFVGDGILTYAALRLAGNPLEEFALVPEQPLTCEFYGLVLPDNDPQWRTLVNQYLVSDRENGVSTKWFADLYPATLNQADFCLNR